MVGENHRTLRKPIPPQRDRLTKKVAQAQDLTRDPVMQQAYHLHPSPNQLQYIEYSAALIL